jgi:hypothetical protein
MSNALRRTKDGKKRPGRKGMAPKKARIIQHVKPKSRLLPMVILVARCAAPTCRYTVHGKARSAVKHGAGNAVTTVWPAVLAPGPALAFSRQQRRPDARLKPRARPVAGGQYLRKT